MARLSVFLDESNHGRRDEVIVALFSYLDEDKHLLYLSKKRRITSSQIKKLLNNPGRDLRFLTLNQSDLNEGENSLIISAPALIKSQFEKSLLRIKEETVYSLDLFLDGGDTKSINFGGLMNKIKNSVPSIKTASAHYYPKTNKGLYEYVPGLEYADSAAHLLFREKTLREHMENEGRRVTFYRI